jgi:hypothetical protein
MRRDFVPQRGEKRRQCGALESIFNAVEVQKNKHVEHKPLTIGYNVAYLQETVFFVVGVF